jgi:hypothetical protein
MRSHLEAMEQSPWVVASRDAGLQVYLTPDGGWTASPEEAVLFPSLQEALRATWGEHEAIPAQEARRFAGWATSRASVDA